MEREGIGDEEPNCLVKKRERKNLREEKATMMAPVETSQHQQQ